MAGHAIVALWPAHRQATAREPRQAVVWSAGCSRRARFCSPAAAAAL